MGKYSLSKKGLSLSQAQSVSNLCFQEASEIASRLETINNVSKSLDINGKTYIETQANPIPADLIEAIIRKCTLHATQAFLVENIKAKNDQLFKIKSEKFVYSTPPPERPLYIECATERSLLEEDIWASLSSEEYNSFIRAEAFASHIGQFIHKGSKLDSLRKELPNLKTLEWITIEDGRKSPLEVTIHHTPEDLLKIHNALATLHREYEQTANYYKAKVKNLLTLKNAEIAERNSARLAETKTKNDLINNKFNDAYREYQQQFLIESSKFEEERNKRIQEVSALRIKIDPIFQDTINEFLKNLKEE
jgi:hypothetical protein